MSETRDPNLIVVDALLDGTPEGEDRWFAAVQNLLEPAYLAAETVEGGSGFGGDAERWARSRRPIAAAVHRPGAFLDVGCANGLLLESLVRWTTEDGHPVDPYGLDISAAIVAEAQRRLPWLGGRLFVGNVLTWQPPRRFDFVSTELVYVPEHRQPDLVAHILDCFLVPGGRAIFSSSGSARRALPAVEPVADKLLGWGFAVAGEAAGTALGRTVIRVAWVEAGSTGRAATPTDAVR